MQYNFFTRCQSEFIPGNSRVSQSLSITHGIENFFDCHPPCGMRGIFLDISKTLIKFGMPVLFLN